jgi:hypothetical protein
VKMAEALKRKSKTITFTFDFLFKRILEFCEESAHAKIRTIANWKIGSSENILRSLLLNNLDKIAW